MTKKTLLTSLALGGALMLGMTATGLAQSTNGTGSGTIKGTVLDPSGALIPQAEVTVSNANGFSRTIRSGATGAFQMQHLAAGSYSVSVNATGFTPALDGEVLVLGDKVTRETVTLSISVNQEIEVSAYDDTPASNR